MSSQLDEEEEGENDAISGGVPNVMMDVDRPDKLSEGGEGQGPFHQLPLRLFASRESYLVNDVLGKTTGPPDIDHNQLLASSSLYSSGSSNTASKNSSDPSSGSVASMHSRTPSGTIISSTNTSNNNASSSSATGTTATKDRKKAVGFAPAPPPYHRPRPAPAVQPVHLNSTDGLVVVSAFLPVVLHRADGGIWSADWDYEALLSMQTHLRVTRIGVVKWRGWHGNFGSATTTSSSAPPSASSGVPINERHLVEECLRPFNCVPVWIDPAVFGEMYVQQRMSNAFHYACVQ